MKKTTAIILSALILVSVFLNAFAADTANRVYADKSTIEGGETVTIPVKIENNEGFMGFAVFVTYNEDIFTPISVTKGSILSGLFNDSITTSKTNIFKVVCSETSNVTSDGVLFNLKFDVADGVSGKYEIELSYSQQDTFDENWKDVVFACEDIEVIVTENGTTVPTMVITTQPVISEPTTVKHETTTVPAEMTTILPVTEPLTEVSTQISTETSTEPAVEPDAEKSLSVRMKEWVKALAKPFNVLLGIFVYPLASVISIFE